MIVTVLMVIEYGVLKVCLAFSDEALAQQYFEQLRRKYDKQFVFKTRCKLDDLTALGLREVH